MDKEEIFALCKILNIKMYTKYTMKAGQLMQEMLLEPGELLL